LEEWERDGILVEAVVTWDDKVAGRFEEMWQS